MPSMALVVEHCLDCQHVLSGCDRVVPMTTDQVRQEINGIRGTDRNESDGDRPPRGASYPENFGILANCWDRHEGPIPTSLIGLSDRSHFLKAITSSKLEVETESWAVSYLHDGRTCRASEASNQTAGERLYPGEVILVLVELLFGGRRSTGRARDCAHDAGTM